MKRSTIIRIYREIFLLIALILFSVTGNAQQTQGPKSTPANDSVQLATTDTLPESAYELKVPAHTTTFYTTHMAGILFTVLIILMAFVSYRYWNDNRTKRNVTDNAES